MTVTNSIREPAVAGAFYSANGQELSKSVHEMLQAATRARGESPPKAIIAPHAGHMFSGPVAAEVYARLVDARDTITRVVLLGPSHRVPFRGIAATTAGTYRTPLGDIPVDSETLATLTGIKGVGYLDEAHTHEHSLEVHLPFLQEILGTFTLVPLVVGDAPKEDVARVLETLWGGPETLIIISSDLSHYHPYDEARILDANTSKKILQLDASLVGEEACGCRPINGLLHLAKQRGMSIQEIDIRNSGDTAGPRDRVVGYGAYTIAEDNADNKVLLPRSWRQRLLQVARESIWQALRSQSYAIDMNHYPRGLTEERASFVTLKLDSRLRGCIGTLVASRPLVSDVAHNAQAAAFKDPRFQSLTLEEYHDIEVHLSVLSPPEPLQVTDKDELLEVIRPGTDGLIIEENGKRATYLPSVWEQLDDPDIFVDELRRKAGLTAGEWSPETRVFRYTTEEFS
ncbi:MAG: AmmeMemoRadiSam system protein B [Pseudomonadales bacterium]